MYIIYFKIYVFTMFGFDEIYNKINKVNNKRYNKCVIIYI